MPELLYFPRINPPRHVLNHAILYRDNITTLALSDVGQKFSNEVHEAADAGLYKALDPIRTWSDDTLREKIFSLAWPPSIYSNEAAADETEKRVRWIFPLCIMSRANVDEISRTGNYGLLPTTREYARYLGIDREHWTEVMGATFGSMLRERFGYTESIEPPWSEPYWQLKVLAATATVIAEETRHDSRSELIVPYYSSHTAEWAGSSLGHNPGHLLTRVDMGQFLPEPPQGIDTRAVIAFRLRYDDERRRLVNAVERLVKEAARAHGPQESADIERDVRNELRSALADMKQAGRSSFSHWMRRTAWFTVASSIGTAIAGPAGAAAASVAANWSSNPIPRRTQKNDYTYLYRVQHALEDFTRMTT